MFPTFIQVEASLLVVRGWEDMPSSLEVARCSHNPEQGSGRERSEPACRTEREGVGTLRVPGLLPVPAFMYVYQCVFTDFYFSRWVVIHSHHCLFGHWEPLQDGSGVLLTYRHHSLSIFFLAQDVSGCISFLQLP